MKKSFVFVLLALILFSISFAAAAPIDLTAPSAISGDPGNSASTTFVIKNVNDTNPITGITVSIADLTDGTNLIRAAGNVSFTYGSSLLNNSNQTVSVNVSIPQGVAASIYSATINVSGTMNGSVYSNSSITLQLTVNQKRALDILNSSLTISEYTGEDTTAAISIKNIGSVALSNIQFANLSALNDSENNTILLSMPSAISLAVGETKSVNINASIPEEMDLSTYSTTILASNEFVNDTMTLSITVKVKYCEEGQIGSLVTLSIEDPDTGDDFNVGETFKLKLKITNEDNDDPHDIIVEADLYDLTDNEFLEVGDEYSITIQEDDSETIYMNLTIPSDTDENNSIAVYVRAYIDDDDYAEDEQCKEASVNIDIERQKHDIMIDSFTLASSSASCGSTVDAIVGITNVGKNDEDSVKIRVYNNLLGIDTSKIIEDFESEDDSEQPLTVSIPLNLTAGNYTLTAEVSFDYRSSTYHDSNTQTAAIELKGANCVGPAGASTATVSATNNSVVLAGSQLLIPVTITNTGTAQQTFILTISGYESWATSNNVTSSLTVDAGSSKLAYVSLTPRTNSSGLQSLTLTTTYGGKTDSKTVSVNVQKSSAISSWFDQFLFELKSNPVWITIDIALIGAIIYVIVWLFVKK